MRGASSPRCPSPGSNSVTRSSIRRTGQCISKGYGRRARAVIALFGIPARNDPLVSRNRLAARSAVGRAASGRAGADRAAAGRAGGRADSGVEVRLRPNGLPAGARGGGQPEGSGVTSGRRFRRTGRRSPSTSHDIQEARRAEAGGDAGRCRVVAEADRRADALVEAINFSPPRSINRETARASSSCSFLPAPGSPSPSRGRCAWCRRTEVRPRRRRRSN